MSIPVNLNEYEVLARERLLPMVYDYFAEGAKWSAVRKAVLTPLQRV